MYLACHSAIMGLTSAAGYLLAVSTGIFGLLATLFGTPVIKIVAAGKRDKAYDPGDVDGVLAAIQRGMDATKLPLMKYSAYLPGLTRKNDKAHYTAADLAKAMAAPGAQATIRKGFYGPVLAVMRAENFDEALAIANATSYKLTGGKSFVTDVTNASRTLLMDLHTLQWDAALLQTFGVPAQLLPEIVPSSAIYGLTAGLDFIVTLRRRLARPAQQVLTLAERDLAIAPDQPDLDRGRASGRGERSLGSGVAERVAEPMNR